MYCFVFGLEDNYRELLLEALHLFWLDCEITLESFPENQHVLINDDKLYRL